LGRVRKAIGEGRREWSVVSGGLVDWWTGGLVVRGDCGSLGERECAGERRGDGKGKRGFRR
jgi:hypothetical protein